MGPLQDLGNEAMIEPVTALGTRPMVEISDFQFQGPERGLVDPLVQERFEEALQADNLRVAETENTQLTVAADDVGAWAMQPGPAEAALQANGQPVAATESTQLAADLRGNDAWVVQPGPAEAAPGPSLSEIVSNELQGIRETWFNARADMAAAFEDGGLTVENAMRLQMDMQHAAVMIQMLVSQVSALNQEVSKLMRAS